MATPRQVTRESDSRFLDDGDGFFTKDHALGATVRPTIWPTPILNEGDSLDCRWEGTMAEDLVGSPEMQWIAVEDPTGNIAYAQEVIIERTGANEESCHVLYSRPGAGTCQLAVNPTLNHPAGSYVTTVPYPYDFARKFMEIINTPGDPVAGRYGPDQSSVIEASLDVATFALVLWFQTLGAPNANYGKLGNLDVVLTDAPRPHTLQGPRRR